MSNMTKTADALQIQASNKSRMLNINKKGDLENGRKGDMMKNGIKTVLRNVGILSVAILLFFSIGFGGCQKEGPAEKAGEKMDEAVEEVGDTIEEAGDSIEDATD